MVKENDVYIVRLNEKHLFRFESMLNTAVGMCKDAKKNRLPKKADGEKRLTNFPVNKPRIYFRSNLMGTTSTHS